MSEPESDTDAESAPDSDFEAEPGSSAPTASDADPAEALVERVADDPPEAVASELHALREQAVEMRDRLDEREARVEELESSLKRTKADFQNYKKRQERRHEQERRRATEDLVERLLDVRDNLSRALDADGETADIRDGVESTLRQFDRVLEEEGVERVAPDPGAAVDPQRHEVLMRVSADQPEGAVVDLHRPGYEMGEKVLRPAQVTVSDGLDGDATGDGADPDPDPDPGTEAEN
jgi:molecular chaperone GrpE